MSSNGYLLPESDLSQIGGEHMEGLHLGIDCKSIEKVNMDAHELHLLAKGDGVEVLLQKIKANEMFIVEPSDVEELMEYFHILEGNLLYDPGNTKVELKQGEFFYVHRLKESTSFKTISDVTLLYVSSRPIFHFLSASMKDLSDIMDKIQNKDQYTHDHCDRVKFYSLDIGLKLHLSKERLEDLGYAAMFHDIGKVNVPIEVLNKSGRLTDEEFRYIKKHPGDGEMMVHGTMYENINRIIEQHHERLDGSGYPKRLKEEEILLEAKIIAVADTYDAMTTDRPYRKGLSAEIALNELKRLKGTHYDQKVVDAFEEVLLEQGIIQIEVGM